LLLQSSTVNGHLQARPINISQEYEENPLIPTNKGLRKIGFLCQQTRLFGLSKNYFYRRKYFANRLRGFSQAKEMTDMDFIAKVFHPKWT
jgi:hypothetical protein